MTEALPAKRIRVAKLPADGIRREVTANEKQREAVARFAGFAEVKYLHGDFHIAPYGEDGALVKATISADIVQPCVVTLEPVEEHVSAPLEIRYLPQEPFKGRPKELVVDIFEDDPPEIFDGFIDLWQIAVEALILHADPFPRSATADEALAASSGNSEASGGESPFAALSRLRSGTDPPDKEK